MPTLYDRLNHCNREIQKAVAENRRLHTEAERAGIIVWESDTRRERESILTEIATQEHTIWEQR